MIKDYRPEILSPAGTFSCFLSALGSGADAVYFGGQLFNARAGAGNFSSEEIKNTVQLARRYGVRTHLTVNTSIKEKEWGDLTAFLDEVLPLGVDAVIVQDPGVASYIAAHFPAVELHASTQAAVSTLSGVMRMKELGFRRVVLARELSLSEIEYIRSHTSAELEVFIHGALCYSYSGRCLMSSFHGGRSGNRGACAQPCRMVYGCRLDGKPKSGLWMNMKDRSALSCLKELMDMRIDSFKIEGRMKSEAYVSGVTRFYQDLKNEYLQTGTIGEVDPARIEELMQLYNRGSFTDGYFRTKEGMIESHDPKNQGIVIGKATASGKGRITVRSDKVLHAGDELKIIPVSTPPIEIRLAKSMIEGPHTASFDLRNAAGLVSKPSVVRRIVDPVLNERLVSKAMELPILDLEISTTLKIGEATLWEASCEGEKVCLAGPVPEKPSVHPTDEETIIRQVGRLGGTPFTLSRCRIDMPEEVFIPVSKLNEVRRQIVQMISERLETRSLARGADGRLHRMGEDLEKRKEQLSDKAPEEVRVLVQVQNDEQLDEVIRWHKEQKKDLPDFLLAMEGWMGEDKSETILYLRKAGLLPERILVRLPLTARDKLRETVLEEMRQWLGLGISRFEASLPGQIGWIRQLGAQASLGPEMGVWNRQSAAFYLEQEMDYSISRELSLKEIGCLGCPEGSSMVVYGRIPYMITEQCSVRECFGCRKKNDHYILTDRRDEKIRGVCQCKLCYNVLYSQDPACCFDQSGYLGRIVKGREKAPARTLRIELTVEKPEEIRNVLSYLWKQDPHVDFPKSEGHFWKEVM